MKATLTELCLLAIVVFISYPVYVSLGADKVLALVLGLVTALLLYVVTGRL